MSEPAEKTAVRRREPWGLRDASVLDALDWEARAWEMVDDSRFEAARGCFNMAVRYFAVAGDTDSVCRVLGLAFEVLGICVDDEVEQ